MRVNSRVRHGSVLCTQQQQQQQQLKTKENKTKTSRLLK